MKAKFTPEEERYWEFCFTSAVEDGATDEEADKTAWELTVIEFPRLKAFDGARP